MFAWLWWALLLAPATLALGWALTRTRQSIDAVRHHDPHMVSDIEQVAYGTPAALPMRDRSFEKPRHPNHF